MKKHLPVLVVFLFAMLIFTGCDFIGGIFQTGVGVGIFIAVIILILIFFIGRIGKRR